MPDFLTVGEFAAELRVHEDTVLRWLKTGKVEGRKPMGQWRIPKSELERLLSRARGANGAE